jgi:hypothetical protein
MLTTIVAKLDLHTSSTTRTLPYSRAFCTPLSASTSSDVPQDYADVILQRLVVAQCVK